MKIRSDFVSNSSSSSFIVSVPKTLGLEAFSQQFADSCSCSTSTFHSKKLAEENKRKLDFCLSTYELLFFGRFAVAEKETQTAFADILSKASKRSEADELWKLMTQSIYESQYRKAFGDDYNCSKNYIDEMNKVVHTFCPQIVDRVVVDKYMLNDFVQWGMNRSKTKFDDENLQLLKQKLENLYSMSTTKTLFKTYIDLYQITKNTIHVTEAMKRHFPGKLDTSSGYNHSEKLYNKVKEHVKKGNAVCYITANYSGGGIDAYSVYQEDGSYGISAVDGIEVLGSEAG